MGMVIRNHNGIVMVVGAQRIHASFSPMIAEVVAFLRGIDLAIEKGMLPIVVETYALSVMNLVRAGCPISSDIGLVIGDVMARLQSIIGSKVVFVPRMANYVAHTLLKMALSLSHDRFWTEEYPLCVERYILDEYPV
ncbi:hypothetical protein Dsin_009374 [Dipteronia sinensis]|uniref:RNase H type-1 domain-containing protein n=1 Tax=Dipteronia sinensis TaxID=43782 RepID=A0AAE0ARP5_9ROSI|nr:hypothetical protein Dsin_009374 [Dipteronia sinensis]